MSCLNVWVRRLGKSLNLVVEHIGGMVVEVSRYDTPIIITTKDIGSHLQVLCGVVCDVGDLHVLRVSPEEVQWITPTQGVIYTVESDTDWKVITN